MPPTEPYELAPFQGQAASNRDAQLRTSKFVQVRNLAHHIYKKLDANGRETADNLMTYGETLDDRDKVFQAIIDHEVKLGLIILDAGYVPGSIPQASPTQGAAPMSQFSPQPAAQQQQQFQPQAGFAPAQPQQQFQPTAQAPATMAGAVAAGQAPIYTQQTQIPFTPPPNGQVIAGPAQQPQAQAEPPAPPTRTRRTKAQMQAAASGSAVAPPPAAPPAAQAPQQFAAQPAQAPQQFTQQAPQQAPAAFQPQAFQPGAPQQQFAPLPQQPQQAPIPQQVLAPSQGQQAGVPAIDLSPILGRLDSLGAGVERLVNTGATAQQVIEGINAVRAELKGVAYLGTQILGALHHMYLTMNVNPNAPKTLPEFQQYLAQFVGSPQ